MTEARSAPDLAFRLDEGALRAPALERKRGM